MQLTTLRGVFFFFFTSGGVDKRTNDFFGGRRLHPVGVMLSRNLLLIINRFLQVWVVGRRMGGGTCLGAQLVFKKHHNASLTYSRPSPLARRDSCKYCSQEYYWKLRYFSIIYAYKLHWIILRAKIFPFDLWVNCSGRFCRNSKQFCLYFYLLFYLLVQPTLALRMISKNIKNNVDVRSVLPIVNSCSSFST